MPNAAKVAISLPEELLGRVEEIRKTRGETRSQYFRRAVERLLTAESEDELERQYIAGYEAMPETAEEDLSAASYPVLALLPWDDEDGK